MTEHIGTVLVVAKALSALALVVLVVALIDVRRRRDMPVISYGGLELSASRMRWLWFGLLVGSLGVAAAGDLLAMRSHSFEDPLTEDGHPRTGAVVIRKVQLPLPFYRYERVRQYRDGHLVEEEVVEGALVPWALISALFAYLVLVVRWNPDSRWASRALHGWRRGRGDAQR
jgi:hypothetical protein